jgi:hypothetical protein
VLSANLLTLVVLPAIYRMLGAGRRRTSEPEQVPLTADQSL